MSQGDRKTTTRIGTVALIAHGEDEHADELALRLGTRKGITVVRLSRDQLPADTYTVDPGGSTLIGGTLLDAHVPMSGFWRRPSWPDVGQYEAESQAFVHDECVDAFDGALRRLPIQWITAPAALQQAELKIRQLTVAAATGACVPRTLVTNDAANALAFAATVARVVVKPVRYGLVTSDRPLVVWTTEVSPASLEALSGTPVILQERLEAVLHLRCVTVGERSFVAALEASATDWRADLANHERFVRADDQLAERVGQAAQRVATALEIGYSAQDWISTADGAVYFLEANPNGQWLFLDHLWAGGITGAIADVLEGLLGGEER